jgi:fanconi-associated nuclease 1
VFWDVIFAPVAGVFETDFQTAPLDIADESFYHAREEIIEERLKLLRADKDEAARRIEAVYERFPQPNDKKPWCVGVRWDAFKKEDILEIAKVRGTGYMPQVVADTNLSVLAGALLR